MVRKIFSWTLIILSSIFFLLGIFGIGATWIFKEPLTRRMTSRLKEIDVELSQAQTTLESTQTELERALRIVDATGKALNKLTQGSKDPQVFFEDVQSTLDDELLPDLRKAKERLEAARNTLEDLRTVLAGLQFVPFIVVDIPDQILTDLIDSATSLDSDITDVEGLAQQASTFLSDTSNLFGGDFSETRDSLQNFLAVTKEYQRKVTGWRAQVADLQVALPKWIDRASIILTIFLLWFGFSQIGLLLHGLSIRRGDNPLEVLRRQG